MKHFLAYGNSDQASFRSPDVRNSMDFLTVPGTIAAYYADATAAFVLSSDLDYIIDPRTPLFQALMDQPRASHYELANHLGDAVRQHLGDPDAGLSVQYGADFFTASVVEELVGGVLAFQRNYGGRAPDIEEKLARYRRLLHEALAQAGAEAPAPQTKPPHFVLAPYFVSASRNDRWWGICEAIWQECLRAPNPDQISPVVAVQSSDFLGEALSLLPRGLNNSTFFWVQGMDERRAFEGTLREVWTAVSESSRELVNLYGGFFSICMHHAGLWGFNNGLGYSEARSWPELAVTGAAAPRYYLPALHSYLTPRLAQLIVDADPEFACQCSVCLSGGPITSIRFHDLKRHFALTRTLERQTVEGSSVDEIADTLNETFDRYEANVRSRIPPRLGPDVSYLRRWATIITGN